MLLAAMAAAVVRLVVHLDEVRTGGDNSLFLTDVSLLSLLAGAAIAFAINAGRPAVLERRTREAAAAAESDYADRYGTWIKEGAATAMADERALAERIDELRQTAEHAEKRALEAMAGGIEAQRRKDSLEAQFAARYRAEAGAKELRWRSR